MTEAEKYFEEWSKSRKHGFTLINPNWVGIAFTEKEMIAFAKSYKEDCIASITDEMIEEEANRKYGNDFDKIAYRSGAKWLKQKLLNK